MNRSAVRRAQRAPRVSEARSLWLLRHASAAWGAAAVVYFTGFDDLPEPLVGVALTFVVLIAATAWSVGSEDGLGRVESTSAIERRRQPISQPVPPTLQPATQPTQPSESSPARSPTRRFSAAAATERQCPNCGDLASHGRISVTETGEEVCTVCGHTWHAAKHSADFNIRSWLHREPKR